MKKTFIGIATIAGLGIAACKTTQQSGGETGLSEVRIASAGPRVFTDFSPGEKTALESCSDIDSPIVQTLSTQDGFCEAFINGRWIQTNVNKRRTANIRQLSEAACASGLNPAKVDTYCFSRPAPDACSEVGKQYSNALAGARFQIFEAKKAADKDTCSVIVAHDSDRDLLNFIDVATRKNVGALTHNLRIGGKQMTLKVHHINRGFVWCDDQQACFDENAKFFASNRSWLEPNISIGVGIPALDLEIVQPKLRISFIGRMTSQSDYRNWVARRISEGKPAMAMPVVIKGKTRNVWLDAFIGGPVVPQ